MLAEQLGADYDSPEVVGAEFVLTRWWIRRRIVFVEKFEHAPTICRWAKLVNLADKIANLSDIVAGPPADWPLKRATGILRLVQAVVDSLQRRTGPRPPARDHNNSSVSSLAIS